MTGDEMEEFLESLQLLEESCRDYFKAKGWTDEEIELLRNTDHELSDGLPGVNLN